jgi:hypothetical protein
MAAPAKAGYEANSMKRSLPFDRARFVLGPSTVLLPALNNQLIRSKRKSPDEGGSGGEVLLVRAQ